MLKFDKFVTFNPVGTLQFCALEFIGLIKNPIKNSTMKPKLWVKFLIIILIFTATCRSLKSKEDSKYTKKNLSLLRT